MSKIFAVLTLVLLLVFTIPFHCIAQEEKTGDDLAAKTQNPVGAMYSLPFKFTFDYGAANGEATFLNIQPVIPVTVGNWNLINRVIVPLIDTPGLVTERPKFRILFRAMVPPVSGISTTLSLFHRLSRERSSGVSDLQS